MSQTGGRTRFEEMDKILWTLAYWQVLHERHYHGGSCDGPGSKLPLSSGTLGRFSPPSKLYMVFVWVLWPLSPRRYLVWAEDRLHART